jgi:hypothetical protein
MKDYDTLIQVLPLSSQINVISCMSDSSLCVLKLAASENILSANSKHLLVGFGKDIPLSVDHFDKPNILTLEARRQIQGELIANRDRMTESLNNRRR